MRQSSITVATYNLYLGADLSLLFGEVEPDRLAARVATLWSAVEASRPVERMHAAAAVLARRPPDVLAVQEAALWRAGAGGTHRTHDLLELLLDGLRGQGLNYRVAARTDAFTSGPLSGALREITGQVVELADRSAILVRDEPSVITIAPTWGLFRDRLSLAVLGRPIEAVRGWCAVDLILDQTPVRVVNAHLEAFDAGVRAAQAAQLLTDALATASAASAVRQIVLGDINCLPPTCRSAADTTPEATPDAYETLVDAGLTDTWLRAHPDDECGGATCGQAADLRNAASALDQRIDLVFTSPGAFEVRDAEVLGGHPDDRTPSGLWPSDHGCLVVDLDLSL